MGKGESVQLRGLLPEKVVVSAPLDPYMDLKGLSGYSSIPVRTLRSYLDRLEHPLPCYRLGQKILVRISEFDHWMEHFARQGRPSLTRALRELGLSKEE